MDNLDRNIIQGIKRGDEKSFRFIYDTHYTILCNIAKFFVSDSFLAEAIVEDVIFCLWEKREEIEITTSLRGYLVRCVKNSCINHLQKKQTRVETTFSSHDNLQELESSASNENYPAFLLIERELEQKIQQSILRLPDECQKIFRMSRFQHLKYQEIAERQNISVNTVKYHIKNALERLRDDLREYL